jgi:NAD-dependent histone deacetylase SIR2
VGRLEPAVLLVGEDDPLSEAKAAILNAEMRMKPDVVLIAGTELKAGDMLKTVRTFKENMQASNGGKVVMVNKTKLPASIYAGLADFFCQMTCEEFWDATGSVDDEAGSDESNSAGDAEDGPITQDHLPVVSPALDTQVALEPGQELWARADGLRKLGEALRKANSLGLPETFGDHGEL